MSCVITYLKQVKRISKLKYKSEKIYRINEREKRMENIRKEVTRSIWAVVKRYSIH